jgi:hypothetical protein
MVTVAIGGSLRFFKQMNEVSEKLRVNDIEHLMANPSLRDASDLRKLSEEFQRLTHEEKARVESRVVESFLQKIRQSDMLYIVNPVDGYVGLHAMGDMFVAYERKKPVYTWQKVNMEWIKEEKDYYEPDYERLQEYLRVIVTGQMTPDDLVDFLKKKK